MATQSAAAQESVSVAMSPNLPPPQEYSGLLLVGIPPGIDVTSFTRKLASRGFHVERAWPKLDIMAVRPQAGSARTGAALEQNRQRLLALPQVRFAEYDRRIEAAAQAQDDFPNDPIYPEQWALLRIGMPTAWQITVGDPSLVIALIDSGYNVTHEDLDESSRWVNVAERDGLPGVDDDENGFVDDRFGWDWVDDDATPTDTFGHGTHVGGTMAATTNNGIGVAAIGRRFKIMSLRVLDERGSGFVSDLIDALAYARHQGAKIVNLSLVLRIDSVALHEAIRATYAAGTIIVAATGNLGGRVYWPAAYTETVAVAATDRADLRASFSNMGPETDVAAPGVDVISTYLNDSYYAYSGTSMATPHVSALAGLIWSLRPDFARRQVVDLILATADDVNADTQPGRDDSLGTGRIDAAAALERASVGTSLAVSSGQGGYLYTTQPLHYGLRLSVPGSERALPVVGALIQYSLTGPTSGAGDGGAASPPIDQGTLETDASGAAVLDFLAPDVGGQYLLRFQVGKVISEAVLSIQDGPLVLSGQSTVSTLTVGEDSTQLRAEARSRSGELIKETLIVHWETSLGHFSDGGQSHTTLARGGIFTQTLHAGRIAGTAHVTVTASDQRFLLQVPIVAGPVYRIVEPEPGPFLLDFGHGGSVTFTLGLVDRFGNPARDGVQVHFYAFSGEIQPETALTTGGTVTAELSVRSRTPEPVSVWAQIPGAFASYRADVPILDEHLWFPRVFVAH